MEGMRWWWLGLALAACGGTDDRPAPLRQSDAGPGAGSGSSGAPGSSLDDALTCGDNHLFGATPGSDVIIVVDSSGSMEQSELLPVQQALQNWLGPLAEGGAHVVLLGLVCLDGACSATADPRVHHLPVPVSSTDSLDVAIAVYPAYASHLRVDAPKHLVIFTDDDATGPVAHAPSFVQAFTDLNPASLTGFTTHAGICFELGNGCDNPGTVYEDLAALTGGQVIDLSGDKFDLLFDPVELTHQAPDALPCDFDIELAEDEIAVADSITVVYESPSGTSHTIAGDDGACDGNGYVLDDPEDPRELTLCPASCTMAEAGGRLRISLNCEERPGE